MSIIRSEKDPRDVDTAIHDANVETAIQAIKSSSNELFSIMETVLNNLDDSELLMLGGDKESFCEMYMMKFEHELLDVADEHAKAVRD